MSKLSIIVSVYNEEAVLGSFIEAFTEISRSFEWSYELIFVNDGSNDNSLGLLKSYCKENSNAKVISFSRNFGHEAAMIAGIDNAKGDFIICMDSDLQHPLECILPIMQKFNAGYEVITMVRVENKSAGVIKNITSELFYRFVNKISDQIYLQENASDFFAISRNVAEILKHNYREKNRFLRGYVQNVGYKKTTLEYKAAERKAGVSHYSIRKLFNFSKNIVISFSNKPLKFSFYAGFAVVLVGILEILLVLYNRKSGFEIDLNFLSIQVCVLFSVLFLLVGIIGEYIAVLFTEVKDRPIYIIEQKINMD